MMISSIVAKGDAMKRRIFTLFLFCAIAVGCKPTQVSESKGQDDAANEITHANLVELSDVLEPADIPGAIISDASRYQIVLTIPPDYLTPEGTLSVRYTNQEAESLAEIFFRLPPNSAGGAIEVSNVKAGGLPCESEVVSAGSAMRVILPQTLQVGKVIDISLSFQLVLPTVMGGNYGLFGFFEDTLAMDVFFPIIPVFDDRGWNVDAPPSNGDLIFTDPSFFDVTIIAPENLVLVASGIKIKEENIGGTMHTQFVAGPTRDFFLAGSTGFKTLTTKVDEITIRSTFPPQFEEAGSLALQSAERAMRIFITRFGAYPFSEFDIVATPMQAGGMEYSGATAITLEFYDLTKKVFNTSASELLETTVAHELAHQWFFNQIMNDQLTEPWLDEAFAQYATYLYYLDSKDEWSAKQYARNWIARLYRSPTQNKPIGLPAGAYVDGSEYSGIIYGKGPLFIAELEKLFAVNDFNKFLLDYNNSFRWKIVDTNAFKAFAEQECACDLDKLFSDWVFSD